MLNAVKQEEDSMKAYSLGLYEKSMPSDLTWMEKLQAAKDAEVTITVEGPDEEEAYAAMVTFFRENL